MSGSRVDEVEFSNIARRMTGFPSLSCFLQNFHCVIVNLGNSNFLVKTTFEFLYVVLVEGERFG